MSCNRSESHDTEAVEVLLSHGIRVSDQGAFFSVAVSEDAIYEWCKRWPASGLRGLKGVTFQFDKRNGDLVDVTYRNGTSEDWDGPALLALSEDAQEAGMRRLEKPKSRKNKTSSDPFIAAHEPAFREMGLSVTHTKGCVTVCKDTRNQAGAGDPFLRAHAAVLKEMGLSVTHTKGCVRVCKDTNNRSCGRKGKR